MAEVSSAERNPTPTRLTPEQEQSLADFVQSWHRVARTQAPDRDEVKAALKRLYKESKAEMPPLIWCDSPWQMVVVKAMLALKVLAIGAGDNALMQSVGDSLKDPLWKRAWQVVAEQSADLSLPTFDGQGFSFADLFGNNLNVELRSGVIAKLVKVEQDLADKLSLPIKLKLREAFRADNDGELAFADRLPLIRTQFGIIQLRGLLGDQFASRFFAQLPDKTRDTIVRLCDERLNENAFLFGFAGQRVRTPGEILFPAQDHLSSPSAVNHLQPVSFVLKHLSVELEPDLAQCILDWLTLKQNLFHVECSQHVCFVCTAPTQATINNRNQLHNPHGPALQFADGSKIYALTGVVMPAEAIESPDKLTVDQIEKEVNLEVRRLLIQQYGLAKYLEDSGAEQIDADEFGVLYKKVLPNDEPVVVVKVTNATPEPDGTYKFYFLRVPPHMTSARTAVAWTFNMNSDEYQPAGES